MDTKIEIKEEIVISDIGFQNEGESFSKDFAMKVNSDATQLNDGCEMELKEEACFPHYFAYREEEFVYENPVKNIKECSNDSEIDKLETKEELCWLEIASDKAPNFNGEIENMVNEDFGPPDSSGSHIKASEYKTDGNNVIEETHTVREICSLNSKKFDKCVKGVQICNSSLLSEKVCLDNVNKRLCCDICGRTFAGKSSFKIHWLIHKGKKPHKCNTCEKRFTQLGDLQRHTLIHEGIKPHKCGTCEKKFTRVGHLKQHKLTHEGKKPYKCDICDKSFSRLGHLNRHKLIHEGKKPYKCDTCEKMFTLMGHLKRHILIHEGNKPYKCDTCNNRFTRLGDLNVHKLIHEGKKPHKCDACGKRYTQLGNFKRHALIHEGKRAYTCDTCNKSFSRLEHLKRHKLVHEEKKKKKNTKM